MCAILIAYASSSGSLFYSVFVTGFVGLFALFAVLSSAIPALLLEYMLFLNSYKITGAALLALAVLMVLAGILDARFLEV